MKLLFSFLIIALFSSVAFANITADQEHILNTSSSAAQKVQLGTLVNKTRNLLVAKYSYAVQGGTTVSDINLLTNLGNRRSYAKLPDNAIITDVWLDVLTQPVSSGNATVAVTANSAGDLLASTAKAALPVGFKQGIPMGSTTTFVKLTAERTVTATIGTAPLTAGKVNVYIEYVIGD